MSEYRTDKLPKQVKCDVCGQTHQAAATPHTICVATLAAKVAELEALLKEKEKETKDETPKA